MTVRIDPRNPSDTCHIFLYKLEAANPEERLSVGERIRVVMGRKLVFNCMTTDPRASVEKSGSLNQRMLACTREIAGASDLNTRKWLDATRRHFKGNLTRKGAGCITCPGGKVWDMTIGTKQIDQVITEYGSLGSHYDDKSITVKLRDESSGIEVTGKMTGKELTLAKLVAIKELSEELFLSGLCNVLKKAEKITQEDRSLLTGLIDRIELVVINNYNGGGNHFFFALKEQDFIKTLQDTNYTVMSAREGHLLKNDFGQYLVETNLMIEKIYRENVRMVAQWQEVPGWEIDGGDNIAVELCEIQYRSARWLSKYYSDEFQPPSGNDLLFAGFERPNLIARMCKAIQAIETDANGQMVITNLDRSKTPISDMAHIPGIADANAQKAIQGIIFDNMKRDHGNESYLLPLVGMVVKMAEAADRLSSQPNVVQSRDEYKERPAAAAKSPSTSFKRADSPVAAAAGGAASRSSDGEDREMPRGSVKAAIRPTEQPRLPNAGELIKIKVQSAGTGPGQGIGYLADGTKVVVNEGSKYIGSTIDALVLSIRQTSLGQIIFCNVPIRLPKAGELMKIKIQSAGTGPGQGIGYLADGTKVVVNEGSKYIGNTIDALVLSVKQTFFGSIIFCNVQKG